MKMRVYPHDRSSKYPGNIRLLCSMFESTQDIHYINVLSLDWLGLVACAISGPRAKVICSSRLGRDYRNAGFWKSKSSDTMLKWQHQKLADCTWLHHIDPYCTIVFFVVTGFSLCVCVQHLSLEDIGSYKSILTEPFPIFPPSAMVYPGLPEASAHFGCSWGWPSAPSAPSAHGLSAVAEALRWSFGTNQAPGRTRREQQIGSVTQCHCEWVCHELIGPRMWWSLAFAPRTGFKNGKLIEGHRRT